MSDNSQWFHDTRTPFVAADIGAVTLTTTAKALYPAASFPILGGGYFNQFVGKKLGIKMFGRFSSTVTAATGQWNVFFGSGADNSGTSLGTSATKTLTTSQSNMSWAAEFLITTRALGSSGALLLTGWSIFNVALIASTLQPVLIPDTAAAQTTVDITSANTNIISVQFLASAGAPTMQIHDMVVTAYN